MYIKCCFIIGGLASLDLFNCELSPGTQKAQKLVVTLLSQLESSLCVNELIKLSAVLIHLDQDLIIKNSCQVALLLPITFQKSFLSHHLLFCLVLKCRLGNIYEAHSLEGAFSKLLSCRCNRKKPTDPDS